MDAKKGTFTFVNDANETSLQLKEIKHGVLINYDTLISGSMKAAITPRTASLSDDEQEAMGMLTVDNDGDY